MSISRIDGAQRQQIPPLEDKSANQRAEEKGHYEEEQRREKVHYQYPWPPYVVPSLPRRRSPVERPEWPGKAGVDK